MRLNRTTYLGLLCCLAFVVYLRLTRRRRRRNIARLEALLVARISGTELNRMAKMKWAMQGPGTVQEVFEQVFPTSTGNTVSIYSSYPSRGCCISDEDFDRLYERPIRKAESLPEFGGSA